MTEARIMEAVARTLWVQKWMSGYELFVHGDRIPREPPKTPTGAYMDAGRVIGAVEHANGLQIDALWAKALRDEGIDWETLSSDETDDMKEEFGYCLAMMALGTGVSWGDGHRYVKFTVPSVEPGYLPDFAQVKCDECGRVMAESEVTSCWKCHRPTCANCVLHRETRLGPVAVCITCDVGT